MRSGFPFQRAEALPRLLRLSLYGSGHRSNVYARPGRVPVWPTVWLGRSIRGAGQYGDEARRKNDSGAPEAGEPVPYATCRSADDTANKAASRIHDTDPGPLKAHVQEYVMPDNEFLVGVACGAATVLGPGELGTHPGLRHRRRHPDHHAESDDFPPHLEVRTPKGAHREVPGAHPSPDALAASPQI